MWAALKCFALMVLTRICLAEKFIKDQFVDCHSDRMEVHLRFFEPFDGFIYAENHHDSSLCRWYGNTTKYLNLTIPIDGQDKNSCGAALDETIGKVAVTLIVSPLRGVLVSGIANLQISCLFTVKDFTVSFPRVRVLPVKAQADMVTGMAAKPTLFMQILEEHSINGAVLQQANVGQRITLDVVLENAAIYDFTIYSCIAHDGSRSPEALVEIVDANGCGVQLSRAVEDKVYNATINGAKHIYLYMYGFQFTSSEFVHFECQARTCLHACAKQQCSTDRLLSETLNSRLEEFRLRRSAYNDDLLNLTLHAVLQLKPQVFATAKLRSPKKSTVKTGLLLFIVFAGVIVLVASVMVYTFYSKKKKRSIDMCDYHSGSSCADSTVYAQPTHSFIYL